MARRSRWGRRRRLKGINGCILSTTATSSSKERPMDSKKPNRRGFLKDGAALAGLAAGVARSASGQDLRAKGTSKELIAYGDRSHFVTSIRTPTAGRDSP